MTDLPPVEGVIKPNFATAYQGGAGFDISRVPLRDWIVAGLITTMLVLISYRWVDRPVAALMDGMVRPGAPLALIFASLTHLPDLLLSVWLALLVLLPIMIFAAGSVRRVIDLHAAVLIGGSFVFASVVKMVLKVSFGRTWPETWIHNNPSLIRDGVYGFFPFHGGAGWSAFPSGHMTAVISVVAMGMQLWPRLAPLWIAVAVATAVGLVGMNFHFVSDVIAGGYVGSASAAAVLWLASRWSRRTETS
jgi:membrane-associated phospholipid phosphatase